MSNQVNLSELQNAIKNGKSALVEKLIGPILAQNIPATQILSEAVIPGLIEAAELMIEEEYYLPETQTVMKSVLATLEGMQDVIAVQPGAGTGQVALWEGKGEISDIGAYMKSRLEKTGELNFHDQIELINICRNGIIEKLGLPCKKQQAQLAKK